ncbi:MAG: diadenylate cyclase, partial [Deltaproteobacteria bacterium]
VLLVALVVIFQEELRRFFERLAMWAKIQDRAYGSAYHKDVDVITLSVINLAQKGVGALIVIQGDDPLARHIEGGTRLDGILSQSILDSIFDPHSLGHDGAVVIDRGRVAYYGCHLPLSLNPQKIQDRGLRHTAALGLAERSDALCIVVSEERGSMSVAREGRLVSLPSGQELKAILEAFYAKRAPKKESRPFSDLMKKGFGKKATAVLLALTLWSVFGYQKGSIRRDFVIPVEYRNLGTEWMIEGERVTEATVMLSGPEQAFRLLDPQTLKMSVDLSRIGEGEQSVELTRDMVKIPSNLSLEGINPDRIPLTVHTLLPMEMPVEVVTEGNLPAGYTLERIDATPPLVKVLVPSSLGRKGVKIRTESIGLGQLTQTTTVTSKLLLPSEVRLVDSKSLGVKVTIFIQPSPLRLPLKQSS